MYAARFMAPALSFVLVVLTASAPRAQTASGSLAYRGPAQPVTAASLAPHLVGAENYYEQYNFEATLGADLDFYLRVRIANLGPGDGRLELTLRTRDPKTKARLQRSQTFDRDEWSFDPGQLALRAPGLSVRGGPERIEVEVKGEGFSTRATFLREAPGWRPGKGKVALAGGGYYATSIVFPRATVEAEIESGGERHALQGKGFSVHSHSDVAPYKLARRWVQFDSHDNDYAIYLRHFVPAEGQPQQPVSFLLVTWKDRVVFESYRVRIRAEKSSPDEKTKARYPVPRRLVIQAVAPGQALDLVLDGKELYHRSAMLEEAGTLERVVIQQFAEPVDYNFRCGYSLRLVNEGQPPLEFGGAATYSVNYLNP